MLGQDALVTPTAAQRWQVVQEHMLHLAEHHGVKRASKLARKHVPWYSKRLRGSADFRSAFQKVDVWEQQMEVAQAYFSHVDDESAELLRDEG